MDVDLDQGLFVRLSDCFLSPSVLCSLEVTVYRSHLRFPSWKVNYLHKFLRIFLHRIFVYFPPFVYSIISLYQCGLVDTYVTFCVIIQHHFIPQIASVWVIWSPFSWILCPSDIPTSLRSFSVLVFVCLFSVWFECFLTYWRDKTLQVHFVYDLSQCQNQLFLQGVLV